MALFTSDVVVSVPTTVAMLGKMVDDDKWHILWWLGFSLHRRYSCRHTCMIHASFSTRTHTQTNTCINLYTLRVFLPARVLRTRTCAAYVHMWAFINSSVHFLVRWVMNTYSMHCVVGPIFFICAVFQSALMRAYVSVYFIGSINHRSRAHSLPLLDQKSPLKLSVSTLYKLMLVWW